MSLTVYGKKNCPNCDIVRNRLEMNNVPYNYIDVGLDAQARDFLIQEGHRSVPQIYDANGYVGSDVE